MVFHQSLNMLDHRGSKINGIDDGGGIFFKKFGCEEGSSACVIENARVWGEGRGGRKEGDCMSTYRADAGTYGFVVGGGDFVVEGCRVFLGGIGGGSGSGRRHD